MTLVTQIVRTAMLSMMVTGGTAAAIAETLESPQVTEGVEQLTPGIEITDIEITDIDITDTEVLDTEVTDTEVTDTGIIEADTPPDDVETTELEASEPQASEEVSEEASEEASEESAEEIVETEVELDEVPSEAEVGATETTDLEAADLEAVEPEVVEPEAVEPEAADLEAADPEIIDSESTDPEAAIDADSALIQDEPALEALQHSATLSLKDALSIIDSEVSVSGTEARSAVFMGALDQPIIAIEVGMQAIAIDATAGEVLAVQELRELPDSEILAAAETATLLKRYAKVTLEEALQAAESFAGAEAQQVALGVDDGSLVYRAQVAAQEIVVDAGDAQVLYTSNDELEAEAKPNGSIQIMDLEKTPMEK